MILRTATMLLVAIAVAFLVTACDRDDADTNSGGGTVAEQTAQGEESTREEEPLGGSKGGRSDPLLSKQQFVRRANQICERGLAEMVVAFRERNENGELSANDPGTEVIDEILVPSLESQIEEIGALNPPPGDADAVKAFLRSLEGSKETIERQSLSANADLLRVFKPAGRLALAYGIEGCSYGF